MKTYTTTLIAGLILFSCSFVFGQDYAFRVLAVKGSNEVKSGGSWQPLKTGASLRSADEIKLVENAYVGLVSVKGKPLELKAAGNYQVSALESDVSKGGSSVLTKYTDFILSSNSAEAKKNKLSATGAVHRGTESAAIQVMLPPNQHSGVFNHTAVISWDDKTPGPYVVTLRNMFDDVLAKIETADNSIEVDLGDSKYATENAILVEVSSKSDPKLVSQQHLIKKLTSSDQEKVKKSLNEIIGEVSEPTALNKLLLAGFYEESNLFIDAISAYEEAIKLAPDVPYYKEAYDEFLSRHGLKN